MEIAVRAFGKSRLAESGYQLKIVGNIYEQLQSELTDISEEYNCRNAIFFLPFTQNVKPLFQYATAFIQSSRYEGLGRTTAEAMFFGCPVIATAYSGGTLDLIKDKHTGYLFNTIDECADLMRFVSNHDQSSIILNAQAWATSNLTKANYGPKILDIYNSIICKDAT